MLRNISNSSTRCPGTWETFVYPLPMETQSLPLGVERHLGNGKRACVVLFFQECFKVSFLWANVHGNSLSLVIWPAYWEVPEIRVKIKVACLLPWPSGVQPTNGESGTGVFQYKLIISPSPLPGASSPSLSAILETCCPGGPTLKKKQGPEGAVKWRAYLGWSPHGPSLGPHTLSDHWQTRKASINSKVPRECFPVL